jgi:hypothetical protein
MAPQFEIEFLITDIHFAKYKDLSINVSVNYENSELQKFDDTFVLDFSIWKNLTMINPKGFADICSNLEKICNALDEKLK